MRHPAKEILIFSVSTVKTHGIHIVQQHQANWIPIRLLPNAGCHNDIQNTTLFNFIQNQIRCIIYVNQLVLGEQILDKQLLLTLQFLFVVD